MDRTCSRVPNSLSTAQSRAYGSWSQTRRSASWRDAKIGRTTIHRVSVVSFEDQVSFGVLFCVGPEQDHKKASMVSPQWVEQCQGWCPRPLVERNLINGRGSFHF